MTDLEKSIIRTLEKNPGYSDKDLAKVVIGRTNSPRYVNQTCRTLVTRGIILRNKRPDGLIGNWLNTDSMILSQTLDPVDEISEKKIKKGLEAFLKSQGWETKIAWGFTHGIDIEAIRGMNRWIIEVKGYETLNLLPAKIFVSVLGEIIQRMEDPECKYSIALPDIEQFRRLWSRLPVLAKERTWLTALFVTNDSRVTEIGI
jgi:hypothetical protein